MASLSVDGQVRGPAAEVRLICGAAFVRAATAGCTGVLLGIVYDIVLYRSFRNIRPPEERGEET